MKKIILTILVFASLWCTAQDTTYNNSVKFNMTDSVENGLTFQRKVFFEAMVYNQRVNSIGLQFRVEFYNTDGSKRMNVARPYSKEVIITNSNFVVTATGAYIGDINKVLTLYGKPSGDTTSPFIKFPDGRYDLTTAIMGEYDWLTKTFDNNTKLHLNIKAIGQREAAAGKLQ